MSGMSTPEVFEVIGAYSDTGAILECPLSLVRIHRLMCHPASQLIHGVHDMSNSCAESLPETLYGAAVPNNYGSNLRELLAEMYADKEYKAAQDHLEGAYMAS